MRARHYRPARPPRSDRADSEWIIGDLGRVPQDRGISIRLFLGVRRQSLLKY